MGRRRSSRNNHTDHLKPNDVEPKPSNGTVELLGASNSRHDIHLPGLSPQKQPNFLVDGVKRPHERSLAGEQTNQDRGLLQEKYTTKKKSKFCGANVRRSERIKSAIVCSPKANFGIEVENITVTDSEKDEVLAGPELVLEPPQEHESESEQEQSEKSLDEKVDSVLRRIDSLDKIVGWLKSKVEESFCEAPSVAPIGYRSMYFDSQKKIEALTEENQRLNGKLENALGKIEVYEKEIHALIGVLDKTRDSVKDDMISNLAKSVEAAVNVSTQAIHNVCTASASAMKRKRNEG
ncbi:hypothetical protein LR48_Vigan50s000600 [Vigna angularis]|uniref:Uncharacterized protein n=2 Tax=Phaseolus angularis TaxID=3914 RepID=A0A0L9T415_PHAAN|nr:uncharacterized protein LOC108347961 [Vigna angularis]KAG2405802.1 uncharacterized protein HKW66_Vig0050570 [Vigna angularis]KOM25086.1 hypothetical protein LR48_Vigan50s000600 [Vigna angularis]BAT85437.1 hypothetical protein VIGAN_04298500 [Vigna angularis var. angularis]